MESALRRAFIPSYRPTEELDRIDSEMDQAFKLLGNRPRPTQARTKSADSIRVYEDMYR